MRKGRWGAGWTCSDLWELRRKDLYDKVLKHLAGNHCGNSLPCWRGVLGKAGNEGGKALRVQTVSHPAVGRLIVGAAVGIWGGEGARGGKEEQVGIERRVYGSIAFSDEACRELLVLIHLLRVRPDLLDGVQLGVLQDCPSNLGDGDLWQQQEAICTTMQTCR